MERGVQISGERLCPWPGPLRAQSPPSPAPGCQSGLGWAQAGQLVAEEPRLLRPPVEVISPPQWRSEESGDPEALCQSRCPGVQVGTQAAQTGICLPFKQVSSPHGLLSPPWQEKQVVQCAPGSSVRLWCGQCPRLSSGRVGGFDSLSLSTHSYPISFH